MEASKEHRNAALHITFGHIVASKCQCSFMRLSNLPKLKAINLSRGGMADVRLEMHISKTEGSPGTVAAYHCVLLTVCLSNAMSTEWNPVLRTFKEKNKQEMNER